MNLNEKIDCLKKYSCFSILSDSEISDLSEAVTEKIFLPKSFILNQDRPADNIYFIYRGLVKIYILTLEGKVIPIRIQGAPYIAGELNLFDNESTASVETINKTHTLVIPKKVITKLIYKSPGFAVSLLKIITEKLRAANIQADMYFSMRLKERMKKAIKLLTPHFPKGEIGLSQEDISFIVGASRARVTEVLHELSLDKFISLSRQKIKLL